MKRSDLEYLEKMIMEEVVKRRKLGGYSPDAEGILLIAETMMRLLQHLIDEYPEPAPTPRKAKPSAHSKP
jgi:hypothetical protein